VGSIFDFRLAPRKQPFASTSGMSVKGVNTELVHRNERVSARQIAMMMQIDCETVHMRVDFTPEE
jgi:hypothetical protein